MPIGKCYLLAYLIGPTIKNDVGATNCPLFIFELYINGLILYVFFDLLLSPTFFFFCHTARLVGS